MFFCRITLYLCLSAIFLYTGSHFVSCEWAQASRCGGEPVHRFSRKVSKNAHMIWLAMTPKNTPPEKRRWASRQADTQAMDDAILSPVNRSKGAAGCLLQKARRDGHGAGIPNQRLFIKIKRIKRSLTTVGVTDRARVRFHPARGKRQSSSTENSRRLYFIIYFF